MRIPRSWLIALALGLVLGFGAGLLTALLMTAQRLTDTRRNVAQWLFRRPPRVDFEALQQ
ncbi:MAG: hypothetical protein FJ029_15700 [Actinobacteria bacterium]|nr:hypothetical protein [Actinomycetota bacterium]